MKLRKVLSLLVAFAMILTASTAFAYTDVAADSDAYEAVTGLSALKILTGYEDGTFAPEGKVKRSEMAAIIMRALGLHNLGQTNTIFSDVTASHWASGAIAEAFGAGIINGRSLQYAADGVTVVGGTFDPDAEVTYNEAVKMIVAALGYNLKAESMVKPGVNPYPTAYNLIADQKGISDGVERSVGGATRATVAKLVWNALPVELMEQTTFGTEQLFNEVIDKSLLFSKQRAVIMEAKIDELPFDKTVEDIKFVALTNDEGRITSIALDDVATNNYKTNSTGSTTSYVDYAKFSSIKKGACDFNGLQGLKVKVLVDITDADNYTAIAAFPSTSNKTLTIPASLFVGMNGNVIEYYKSLDSTTVNKSSKVEDGVVKYTNLVKVADDVTIDEVADTGVNPGNTTLRFVDTNNNGYYDTLFVDNYASFVVGTVDAETYNIMGDSSSSIYNSVVNYGSSRKDYDYDLVLDPESTTVAWSMKDEAGKELTVADVNVGDVITYAMSYVEPYYFYDITVCKSSAVTGTVDQVKEVKNRAKGVSVYVYTIDGKDYQLNQRELTTEFGGTASKLSVGDSGTFQITADGKIIAVKYDEAVRNFGTVLAVRDNGADAWSEDIQVQLLKADGSVELVSFADKFIDNDDDATKVVESDEYGNGFAAALETILIGEGRVVMYELNAAGEIKALYYGNGIKNKTGEDGYKVVPVGGAYAQASGKLDGKYLVDNSVVIALKGAVDDDASDEYDASNKKNYSLISASSLVDGDDYTGYAVINNNKEVAFVVVEDFVVNPAFDAPAMYVTGRSVVSVDGEERTKLFGIVGKDAVEYVLAEDTTVVAMGEIASLADLSAKAIKAGDVLQFTVNGAGEIDSYRPLVKMDGAYANFLAIADASELEYEDNADDDAVEVALYRISTTAKGEDYVLEVQDIIDFNDNIDVDGLSITDGFGIVGYVNRVNGNNVGIFMPSDLTFDPESDLEKDWATENYVDVAGDVNVYTFVNSEAFGDGYDVKALSSIKTYATANAVSKTDDILYIFKYDDEVVLQYVIDVKGNNK